MANRETQTLEQLIEKHREETEKAFTTLLEATVKKFPELFTNSDQVVAQCDISDMIDNLFSLCQETAEDNMANNDADHLTDQQRKIRQIGMGA